MRKMIIAGNWKMNKTPQEAAEFCRLMKDKVASDKAEVVFCVPFVDLYPVLEELKGTGIGVGAENMHFEDSGAYTGEVSAPMLKEMGVGYVVLGHSERRQYFGETDEMVNKKVKKALEAGIVPIMCCGETLEQREAGITIEWVRIQIKCGLSGVSAEDVKKVVGPSAQAKQPHLNRHRKYAMPSVKCWRKYTARKLLMKYASSTAAVSMRKMPQNCSRWKTSTAVWLAVPA